MLLFTGGISSFCIALSFQKFLIVSAVKREKKTQIPIYLFIFQMSSSHYNKKEITKRLYTHGVKTHESLMKGKDLILTA